VKVTVEVKDRSEAQAVRIAMADPEVHAFVVFVGVLMQLDGDRARLRVLEYVRDHFDERAGQPATDTAIECSHIGAATKEAAGK